MSAPAPASGAGGLGAQEKSEVSVSYKSFDANLGGFLDLGARYRGEFFEAQTAAMGGALCIEAAYAPRFDLKSFFTPRLILGAAVAFGGFGPVAGIGLTFPVFKLFGGSLGIGFDSYVYGTIHGSKGIGVKPVIPLSLTYLF